MIELLLCCAIGLIIGFFSGIFPGLHPNFISSIVIVQNLEPEKKAIIIVFIYAGYVVFSSIPAVFFGIPDSKSILSVLPGQRMAKEGKGIVALKVIVGSVLVASIGAVLLIPFAFWFYPVMYGLVKRHMFEILIIAAALLIFRAKRILISLSIFLASGLLGQYSFNAGLADAFLPLFSGFFAVGAILAYEKTGLPKQKTDGKIDLGTIKYALLGIVLGGMANLLPGISSAGQIAVFASILIAFESANYLAVVSGINIGQFILAFASITSIDKARHGIVAELANIVNINERMQMLIFFFLIGIGVSALVLYQFRNRIASISKLDFLVFGKILLAYLGIVVYLLDGLVGLMVFAFASIIGYLTLKLGAERTMMMGAIIVPTLLLLAG
ncbi:tripartite tricarboxylate transporter permease [Candidatus Micrarchaeota archaeon]|nr:tripartite tricarboxylate transporter permease [Candidatus Micrarchaeota archaeon]